MAGSFAWNTSESQRATVLTTRIQGNMSHMQPKASSWSYVLGMQKKSLFSILSVGAWTWKRLRHDKGPSVSFLLSLFGAGAGHW